MVSSVIVTFSTIFWLPQIFLTSLRQWETLQVRNFV